MLTVDHYEMIRRKVEIEGFSQREAARVLGHSRKTVAKALELHIPPVYRLSKPRPKPVLDPFRKIKQRQRAKRMHERLQEEYGFTGHYGTVRRYVKEECSCPCSPSRARKTSR